MRRSARLLGPLLVMSLAPSLARAQPEEAPAEEAPAAPGPTAARLAVFPIHDARDPALPAATLRELSEYLAARLASGGRARAVPVAALQRALEERNAETDAECQESACLSAVSRQVSADTAVSVRLSKLGSQCLLAGRVLRLGKESRSAVHRGGCTEDALLAGLDALAVQLGGAPAAAAQVRPSTPARRPPPGAIPFQGHHYFDSPQAMSWFQARDWCAQLGAQLASVTTAAENAFVFDRFARRRVVWLGATDEARDGDWRWLSGERFAFAPWGGSLGPASGKGPNYLLMGTIADGVLPGGAFFRFGDRWISDRDAGGVIYGVLSPHAVCEWVP